ncbi:hypothetical protein AFLA_001937 [Aspergillus flavus NRRL3357]|nr:hypothetical protein AFLA_001937 [Aspergillus flavus NRRL3357]
MYHMRQAPEVFFFLLLLILQYLTLDGILSIHISGVVHSTAANFLSVRSSKAAGGLFYCQQASDPTLLQTHDETIILG